MNNLGQMLCSTLRQVMPERAISMARRVRSKIRYKSAKQNKYGVSSEWGRLQVHLNNATRIIDLGCGGSPHARAIVGVDAFLGPSQRALGRGPKLSSSVFRERGVNFVQADLAALPFADKSFDFAYSHHVFEHLLNPKVACAEMCRVAERGAIITPSIFAEIAFGRPYHRHLVIARPNTIIFLEKREREDRPFGEHPNPFDILLNDGGWYHGKKRMPPLSGLLREYWYSHSPVMEVVFLWEGSFNCMLVHEDGSIE